MAEINFIQALHNRTSRNYVERVTSHDKAECAEVAMRWGEDYWDGDRCFGYGGYSYDGRWRPIAEAMAEHYDLADDCSILDVGCGKGYLLYEFTQILPRCRVTGLDISDYAITHSKGEVRPNLCQGTAANLPWPDGHFDFVVSLGALHNLLVQDLWSAVAEIERVGRSHKYIMVESYRTEQEKANLLYWQLTCRAFHRTDEWEWIYRKVGYTGDWGYIFFE